MPSPALQSLTPLLAAWCACCILIIVRIASQLDDTSRHILFLHFQPVLPPLAMLWLWGAAVRRFNALGIEYEACFAPKDRRFLLYGSDIQQASTGS